MKQWRVGLIGCGWAGEQHVQAMRGLGEQVVLAALADLRADLAEAKAREWQVPVWTDHYPDLLDPNRVDLVNICLPHDLHASVAIEAMEAGLHVLIEKPLATSLAESDAMLVAAEWARVKLMVAENVRYDPTYLKVVELIEAGVLGDLFMIRLSREHEMHNYLRQRPWFLQQQSGGIMVSGGIHDYELLRMLGGEIEHVYGLTARKVLPEMAADDTSLALVGLHSGAAAALAESFSLKTPWPGLHGVVHGSQGSLWFYKEQIELYRASSDGQPERVEEIVVPAENTFEAEWRHFIDCLEHDREPLTNGREQRKPLVAVLATYESFRQGKRIYLHELNS
jgi:predicted dehydrogenase